MFHSRDHKCCEAFICFIIFVVVFFIVRHYFTTVNVTGNILAYKQCCRVLTRENRT